jgi:hypothetical protein
VSETARTSAPADVAVPAGLLHETAEHHAAYLDARRHGSTPDEASQAAGAYMQEARGVVTRPG